MTYEESVEQLNNLLRRCGIGFNKADIEAIDFIIKESQELKEKLNKYENLEDMTLMMMWCTEKVKDENEKLKKQLEDAINSYTEEHNLRHNSDLKLDVLRTQQQKFVKYLKDEIKQNTPNVRWKHCNEDGFNDYDLENPSCIEVRPTDKIFKEILQKYKSIIGVSDETNKQ